MKIRLIALSSSLTLALAGCVLPPKVPPQATLLNNTALGLNGQAAASTANGWWRTFGDPQLDRLIGEAMATNPRLAEVMARVRVAQAQTQSATAAANPGLSFDGQETYERFPEKDIFPPPLGGGHYWRGGLTVNLAWDLDFFGRQAAVIEQNRAYTRAAVLDVENARLALAGALAQAYLDLYRSYALADIAAQTEAQQQDILKLAHERLSAGLDTQSDLRLAEAGVSQARLSRMQSEAGIELAVHR
ncbi:MAG: TolC family protein, partial [Stenotrophobium sp.]